MVKNPFQLQKRLKNYQKISIFKTFQMTSKMFLDMVEVITTSKFSILGLFAGETPGAPPPCQVGLKLLSDKCLW